MIDKNKVGIRNLDRDLLKEARISAIRQNITLGEWLNEAIKAQLSFTALNRLSKKGGQIK